MLFKKNEKKEALKKAIKAKRLEIAKCRKENRKLIDRFVKETDIEIATDLACCIRECARRISVLESELNMLNAQKTI